VERFCAAVSVDFVAEQKAPVISPIEYYKQFVESGRKDDY
jgi:hypothetical protein